MLLVDYLCHKMDDSNPISESFEVMYTTEVDLKLMSTCPKSSRLLPLLMPYLLCQRGMLGDRRKGMENSTWELTSVYMAVENKKDKWEKQGRPQASQGKQLAQSKGKPADFKMKVKCSWCGKL
ncbi:hypothetical protein AMTRI_Chr01g133670 [Amborella trichopoda]